VKWALLFCVAAVATLPISFAVAAQNNDDDIIILAVKPRSPDVKPIAASVSPSGQDISKPQTAQANTQVSRR
jgi:hypothetical protein